MSPNLSSLFRSSSSPRHKCRLIGWIIVTSTWISNGYGLPHQFRLSDVRIKPWWCISPTPHRFIATPSKALPFSGLYVSSQFLNGSSNAAYHHGTTCCSSASPLHLLLCRIRVACPGSRPLFMRHWHTLLKLRTSTYWVNGPGRSWEAFSLASQRSQEGCAVCSFVADNPIRTQACALTTYP